MEITKKTIIIAVVSVIIVAVILSGVFYLLKNSKQIVSGSKNTNPLARLGVITSNTSPTPTSTAQNNSLPVTNNQTNQGSTNTKTYQGINFTFQYPQKWGILTCSDSQNLELDPYNSNDLRNYSCDRAIKPITIIVSNSALSCAGETVKIGNNTVIRSKTETANWLKNRWCINKNGLSFDVTNRVNGQGITGTGKDDFSSDIETIIKSL
ncbi:MAG: hypothetical protein PHQ59_01060 [Candidatus Daviesbacteria bacterium]|nr:hypothetical protein [Candidatus Daviesbacteria bacterium]